MTIRTKWNSAFVIFCGIILIVGTLESDLWSEPNFSMLCGDWKSGTETDFFIESWICKNDGALGQAFEIQAGDTVFSESSNIKNINGEWVLHIQASNQNGGAFIPFYLTEWTSDKLLFENPDHDFPKRIAYQKTAAKALNIVVDGGEGSEKVLNLTFEKVTAMR